MNKKKKRFDKKFLLHHIIIFNLDHFTVAKINALYFYYRYIFKKKKQFARLIGLTVSGHFL